MSGYEEAARKVVEERQAWDRYAAAYLSGRLAGNDGTATINGATTRAAEFADALLKLRKERFE
ncbi:MULTISPECIES: hypothetical protein [Pseudomonas fluorescens group]|uniref:hypothetical protein n=1 Tax=Pseudomonas fluorescens group TaxID=136843 RepID=UPI002A366A2C|nr:hypothetical protein [Pseudomonas marginalis]WPN21813.1 hypothetical protein QMK57_20670 [Pseudomonas marginalis]